MRVAHVEAGDLAAGVALEEEHLAAIGRDVVDAGERAGHGADVVRQGIAPRGAGEHCARVVVLGVQVGVELGLGLAFHPSVGIGDLRAEIVVGDRGDAGGGRTARAAGAVIRRAGVRRAGVRRTAADKPKNIVRD